MHERIKRVITTEVNLSPDPEKHGVSQIKFAIEGQIEYLSLFYCQPHTLSEYNERPDQKGNNIL